MSEEYQSMRRIAAALAALAEEENTADPLLAALVEAVVKLCDRADAQQEQLDALDLDMDDLSSDLSDVEEVVFAQAPQSNDSTAVEVLCPHCKRASHIPYDTLKDPACRCPRCDKPLSFEGGGGA